MQRRIDTLQGLDHGESNQVEAVEPGTVHSEGVQDAPAQNTRSRSCNCCCSSHCRFQFHTLGNNGRAYVHTWVNADCCSLATPTLDDGLKVIGCAEEDHSGLIGRSLEADSLSEILLSLDLSM